MTTGPADQWRIGTLASRVGVSETVLRAWETRYGLLQPARTATGYRLYGPEDERRARAMVAARGRGVPAAQAAADVLAQDRAAAPAGPVPAGPVPVRPDVTRPGPVAWPEPSARPEVEGLRAGMLTYDAAALHAVLDEALGRLSVESVVRDVLLPFLRQVGDGWASGNVDIADEHFATDVIRGRLAALSFGAGATLGPLALLACPPGELHDISLKAFEVVLQRAGWRTRFLGAQTPIGSVSVAAEIIEPDVVVLGASTRSVFEAVAEDITALAATRRVCLAGGGLDAEYTATLGADHLAGDPVEAALALGRMRRAGP